MMPAPTELLSLWHSALAEPLGVYVTTPDPYRLKAMLYTARSAARDPSIAHLQVRTAPPNHRETPYPGLGSESALWIINPPKPAE